MFLMFPKKLDKPSTSYFALNPFTRRKVGNKYWVKFVPKDSSEVDEIIAD